ncbi:MAG TPA: Gfo/Idh/MocA family oxidoreductase [Gemmataceae bacterium]|nr:Gfo/Idh/MocA family oxidoreductase [Gemmataceae bacterium]
MTDPMSRRTFLASAAVAATFANPARAIDGSRVTVGVMGTGGRGTEHCRMFAALQDCTVGYVCDVDEDRMNAAGKAVEKVAKKAPKTAADFRRILEDKDVDGVIIATCNHWHAIAAILACQAGKHVYVEKPCSHNPREGELLVQAARKHKRHVQMGNQRRSFGHYIEATKKVRDGILGRAYLAKSWYFNNRPPTGTGKLTDPPKELNYELWEGPAPHRPFKDNYLHYKWHWFWHWGNGELGNNGVHTNDVCRWGLGVDYPVRVTSAGGRYRYDDDQETPDTHTVGFEFEGKKLITWEGLSCNTAPGGAAFDIIFYGENGSMVLKDGGYSIHDPKGKETSKHPAAKTNMNDHLNNWLSAIREDTPLNSEIEEGHKSTLLCHLGNIAHRTGRALKCDPKDGKIQDDADAMKLWTREYAKGWEPKV